MYLFMNEEKLKKEVAQAINVIIEKYQVNTPKVEWPEWGFKIKGVKGIEINEKSNRWLSDARC